MRFPCTITQRGGHWVARHESADLGLVTAQAGSRQEAIEKLRGELRYRLEICPCTGESYQHIDVEIVEEPA
jgi:hypothetical protein